MKTIDFKKSLYEICKEDPEVLNVMKGLGFNDISSPGMLNTAGRFMTIPKGASMKGIDLERVKQVFRENGYEVIV